MADTELRIDISTYEPNQLNRHNTYRDSGIVELMSGTVKFALGFWPTHHNDKEAPYLALISWTPGGWIVAGILPPIWDNDLTMDMGSESEDLRNYAWFIGNQLTPKMVAYLLTLGMLDAGVNLENWQKVRLMLNSSQIVDSEIVVPYQ
jgi:hypothetical protein